jgi:hypothetical protein
MQQRGIKRSKSPVAVAGHSDRPEIVQTAGVSGSHTQFCVVLNQIEVIICK